MDYTALQVKTSYSILESINDISKLVERASNLGYTSLCITDDNNLFGVMDFYLECKKKNIKPIIGIELNVDDIKVLLYAINEKGYKKLIKLSTSISDGSFVKDKLEDNDNLICIMPYSYFNIDLFDKFKYKYVGYSTMEERNNIDSKYKCVFINDVVYLLKEDYTYLDYLYMIRENKVLGEYELGTHKGKYLLSYDEVIEFSYKEDIANIKEIVDMCNVEIKKEEGVLPVYDKDIDAFSYLSMLCNKGLKRRLNDNVDIVYQKRLDYELSIIKQMGFCDYFLIVWDYVKFAKFNNILVGPGRGSACGSLVSYTLGITDVDPIKYNLLFERFLNPERKSMPDIDIDFDNKEIDRVIDYVTSRYGKMNVAGIITFKKMTAKQVIRDVARVLKINSYVVDNISKNIIEMEEDGSKLVYNYNNNDKFRMLINSNNLLKKLYNISLKLEGCIRNSSVHAAGVVISKYDISDSIPLYMNENKMYLTGYTKDYLESLGLLKMDFLRLDTLNFINRIISDIRENEKINITFEKIPLNDKGALKIFYDSDTEDIFQFDKYSMKIGLSKLKVTSFDDLIALMALNRPGPMGSIENYSKRKAGLEKIDYIHPDLEEVLKPTYGIIIYQEQIMQIAHILAGYSLGEADLLRSAISKKDEGKLLKERDNFINRCISNGYDKDMAVYVYDLILKFKGYGFNKSHSVAYAIISYKMAFLKKHFFKYFLINVLNDNITNIGKTKRYITYARNHNIDFLNVDINESSDKYYICNDSVRCPLDIVKGINKAIYDDIIKERDNGKFVSFIEFAVRCYSKVINKDVLLILISVGAFDNLSYNRKTLVNNIDTIINYVELIDDKEQVLLEEPFIVNYEEYSKKEILELEYKYFGFYLLSHPALIYKNNNDIDLINVSYYFDKIVNFVVEINSIKPFIDKKGGTMAFINGEDNTGNINITLFSNVYSKCNDIKYGDVIRCSGRVERKFDEYKVVAIKVVKLN